MSLLPMLPYFCSMLHVYSSDSNPCVVNMTLLEELQRLAAETEKHTNGQSEFPMRFLTFLPLFSQSVSPVSL